MWSAECAIVLGQARWRLPEWGLRISHFPFPILHCPQQVMVRILGIETSCDETAIGIVEDGSSILANVVASSQQFHEAYGGVIPDIAARIHVEVIWQVLEHALTQAASRLEEIDAVAITQGPGLPGALLIGLAFAKGLALAIDRPLIAANHLAAHLYAGEMVAADLEPPYVGLVVSGGHTLLCVAHQDQRFEMLGQTKDDAVGEAFDKVAKLLGLGYPGGPVIDRLSQQGNRAAAAFPRLTAKEGFDFSFSGLKTAVYQYVQKQLGGAGGGGRGTRVGSSAQSSSLASRIPELSPTVGFDDRQIADIAASFQEAAVDILVTKTLRACHRTGLKHVVVGGGVAANSRLRERLCEEGESRKLRVVVPPLQLCADNGAMVAGLAYELLRRGQTSPLTLNADSHLALAG